MLVQCGPPTSCISLVELFIFPRDVGIHSRDCKLAVKLMRGQCKPPVSISWIIFLDNLKYSVLLFLEVIREKRNCQRAPALLQLHSYPPGYPQCLLQTPFVFLLTTPRFVETLTLTKEYALCTGLTAPFPQEVSSHGASTRTLSV